MLLSSESAAYYDKERSTYDESVDYICNELALAAQVLPTKLQQSLNFIRVTKCALALIHAYGYTEASPLFNGGDAARRSFGTWKEK